MSVTEIQPTEKTPFKLNMTPEAVEHFSKVASGRILVLELTGGGCAGLEYKWSIGSYDVKPSDWIKKYAAFTLVVPEASQVFLNGSTIEFVQDLVGGGVEIDNPNAVGSCGCGVSINFEK